MDLLLVLISCEIIASKFLCTYIKTYRTEHDGPVKHLLFSKIFKSLGIEEDIWSGFFYTTFIVISTLSILTSFGLHSFYWLYIILGTYHLVLNLGEAHSHYFGRENFITVKLLAHRK
jgi:hypothetical protein